MMGDASAGHARDALAELYMPQVEQLGVELHPQGEALVGSKVDDTIDAHVVVYRVDGVCVVTSHRLTVKRDLPFEEHGNTGLCVCTLSEDSLRMCPIAQPRRAAAAGNVAVFGQSEHLKGSWLRAGQVHNATSITLMPEWFDRWEGRRRRAAHELIDEPGATCSEEFSAAINRSISAVSPLFGGALAQGKLLRGEISTVALTALAWYEARTLAERAAGTREQRRLVRAAERYIMLHLDQVFTLDDLAHALLTSRTRLCTAFRCETGESIGAYIRRARMERARELLRVPSLSIGEVARAVGYPRVSSFTVAFERSCGLTPSAWRASEQR